jgi:hypothetical protein
MSYKPTKQEQIDSLNKDINKHIKTSTKQNFKILELENKIEELEKELDELKPNRLVPMPVIRCSYEDYVKGREIANAKGRE